ncbi:MAG: Sec-independent protein translocase protein TatB [Methylococcaceae bacterium]|nr:Sec-independent protein translocase protein TatB [Methylococcaceae bacterium]MCI0734061.1 Sec-independent protein translocase protein TatB [Methylococcaceae bacterium]
MFEVGFWELVLIGVVGLIVIGPERLPGFVRVAGFWLGKARRTIASVKEEFKEELYAEDLRRSLSKNSPVAEIQKLLDDSSKVLEEPLRVDQSRRRTSQAGMDSGNKPVDAD